jgi:ABC-type Fe3+/spermidine/putrescine transport system ATPase subunit
MKAVIEAKRLTRKFSNLVAVNGVDFKVYPGEIFGFLGPNGAGKTTTVRMLTGVIDPTEGTATIQGHDIRKEPLLSRAHIAVVPEEANVYLDLSVWQNLMLIAGIVMGALSFASLGVLLAAPPASSPSNIMLLSNLVRLPLLFVSGIFMPIGQMPVWARWIAPLSPLSYAGALIRSAFGRSAFFPVWLSLLMLVLFTLALFLSSCKFHNMWRAKGL